MYLHVERQLVVGESCRLFLGIGPVFCGGSAGCAGAVLLFVVVVVGGLARFFWVGRILRASACMRACVLACLRAACTVKRRAQNKCVRKP